MKTRRRRIKKNKSIKRGGDGTVNGYPELFTNGQMNITSNEKDESSNITYILGGIGVIAAGVGLTIYFL